MARVRFLADANLDQNIVSGAVGREPGIDFELPQGLITEGMKDPQVLGLAASLGRILVYARCSYDAEAFRKLRHRQ